MRFLAMQLKKRVDMPSNKLCPLLHIVGTDQGDTTPLFKKGNIYDFFKYTSLVNAAQKPFFKLFDREFGKCPPAKHANIKHFFCWLGESTTIDIVKKVYGIYWNVWLCFKFEVLNTSNGNFFTRVTSVV